MRKAKPKQEPGARWWTGAVPGKGAGCAYASRAHDAREEIARDIGVAARDLEVVEC